MNSPKPRASLGRWLLRIFLVSFLLALAAPVVIAFAVLRVSGDTRALRNAAIHGDGAQWHKQIEINAGSLPFSAARLIAPFTQAPREAIQALDALRSADVSIYELRHADVDPARVLRDADERMQKRGWDRVVAVLDRRTIVAVYVHPNIGKGGDVRASVLVLDGNQMVAVTGRAKLEPLFDLAFQKANEEFLDKHRRPTPVVASMQRD